MRKKKLNLMIRDPDKFLSLPKYRQKDLIEWAGNYNGPYWLRQLKRTLECGHPEHMESVFKMNNKTISPMKKLFNKYKKPVYLPKDSEHWRGKRK